MEEKFNAHPGVRSAVITYATKQLRLEAEDPDALIPALQALARTVEEGIVIVPREQFHGEVHYPECGCGHHHEHDYECHCGHDHHDHHEEKPEPKKCRSRRYCSAVACSLPPA